jgi:hypothetical protein
MNPEDEWQKWHEKETQRLQEQQRRLDAVFKAVAITVAIVALLETFVPGFKYLPLFLLGWAVAYNVLKQLKTIWIRWALYVLTLIAFFLATMWLLDEYRHSVQRYLLPIGVRRPGLRG